MKGKLHCRLHDMRTWRGIRDKGAAGKSKAWVSPKDNEACWTVLLKEGGGMLHSCVLGVCALGGTLCVGRQLGHIPRVVASAHSRWELEEVG